VTEKKQVTTAVVQASVCQVLRTNVLHLLFALQELVCLQDHYERLEKKCRDEVQKLTKLESEDAGSLENTLIDACEPMLQQYCKARERFYDWLATFSAFCLPFACSRLQVPFC